jgi:tetratricopeptide (TPR) repeat protein
MLELSRAQEIPDESIRALENLAYLYFNKGQYRRSLPYFEQLDTVLKRTRGAENNKSLRKLNDYALALKGVGQLESAEKHFRQIVKIRSKIHKNNPDDTNNAVLLGAAHKGIGDLRIENGDDVAGGTSLKTAIEILQDVASRDPTPLGKKFLYNALVAYGEYWARQEEFAAAIEPYSRALDWSANPSQRAATHLNLGICFLSQKDFPQAIEQFRKAIEDPAVGGAATYGLACAFSLDGSIDEAFAALNEAIDEGYGSRDQIEEDADLAPLREDPRYQNILKRLDRTRPEDRDGS